MKNLHGFQEWGFVNYLKKESHIGAQDSKSVPRTSEYEF